MGSFTAICPVAGMEQLAQAQWTATLRKLGHRVRICSLFCPRVDPRTRLDALAREALADSPEAIFVDGAIGFSLPEFFLHARIQEIPIVAFWFDDPFRPVEFRKKQAGYLDALRLPNVRHFVWDGHWRKWLWRVHGVRSFPIHLAADADEFQPRSRRSEYADHAVFIGTLVSSRHIQTLKRKLPPVLQRVADAVGSAIHAASYGRNPYEVLNDVLRAQPAKTVSACASLEGKAPEALLNLRAFASKLAKNEVRIRVLREALKIAPLLMLCGNLEGTHAGEDEVRAMLGGDSERLIVRDTSDVPATDLGGLYAYGMIHLQATDPQSVEGGIPFRVFQTTAARRPLLTDRKPELAECYCYGKELLTFESDADFAGALRAAVANPKTLEDVAQAGHDRFLRDHTWQVRFEYVMNAVRDR